MISVLNLYAGIGGNRKLWIDVEVIAIENNPQIAKIYQDFFPDDKVIVADAHQYLLEHFKEFDFIWSSPPCPSHSKLRRLPFGSKDNPKYHKPIYPDMKLYEEILFLQGYFKGKWVVENVMGWYAPLILPFELQRHYFWANFPLPKKDFEMDDVRYGNNKKRQENLGFDLSTYSKIDKTKILRNCVKPELALHIFNLAFKEPQQKLEVKND